MAGNYPDVPSWRMAYDRDGTALVMWTTGSPSQLDHATLVSLNDESGSSLNMMGTSGTEWFAFLFPEPRDLDAFLIFITWASQTTTAGSIQVSEDTTNGVDGTWTSYSADQYPTTVWNGTNYRTGIVSATALAIRGFRFRVTHSGVGSKGYYVQLVHLFGEIAPDENPNRLALWHPTLDQRVVPAYFDWGDVPRSSSLDRGFRVKNLSDVLTANSVRVAMEALTDPTPSWVGQHTLSSDGGTTFLSQVNIGNLAPGAVSSEVILRRNVLSDAVLSLKAHRVFAEANSWS